MAARKTAKKKAAKKPTSKASAKGKDAGKRVPGKPFKKGQSGNPNGRPKRDRVVAELARQHTTKAIEALVNCLADKNGNVRVKAATALLDRGYGKAPQQIDLGGDLPRRFTLAIPVTGADPDAMEEDDDEEDDA